MDLKDFSPAQRARMKFAGNEAARPIPETQPQGKPAGRSKYRAEPCIVTEDLTLFTAKEVREVARAKGMQQETPMPLKSLARHYGIIGYYFHSTKEGRRYIELSQLQKVGQISRLEMQPEFPMHVIAPDGAVLIVGSYSADFRYSDAHGRRHVEDVKSEPTRTAAYELRKKHVEAQYGVVIEELD